MTDTPAPVSAEDPAPDLVETLLAEGRHVRGEPDCVGPAVTLLVERAADEITALRAEVERLTAALLGEETEHSKRLMEVDQLRAENERLTAALREIEDLAFYEVDSDKLLPRRLARAALKEDRT
jgi:hypothetical protein